MEQRIKVEREIARLERRLEEGGPSSYDDELVASVRDILMGMRREHEQILTTLDRVIEGLGRMGGGHRSERPKQRHSLPSSPPLPSLPLPLPVVGEGGGGIGLDSLVERVEVAVSDERETTALHPTAALASTSTAAVPPRSRGEEEQATLPLEMSMATIKYLTRYDLLSPTHRPHLPKTRTVQQPQRPSRHVHYEQRPSPPFTKILDEQVIKRMPKL